ncbi:hypothetical protein AGMMS50276_09570 [Synergistales bacterium]|nr:hypothetical protein AGMMS50276_09570 [Synergistales bacterium]
MLLLLCAVWGAYYYRVTSVADSLAAKASVADSPFIDNKEYPSLDKLEDLRLADFVEAVSIPPRPPSDITVSSDLSLDLTPPPISADFLVREIEDVKNIKKDEIWVRVTKHLYKLYLYKGDKVEKTYSIAVGKNPGNKERAGDHRTPNGVFTVQSVENSAKWTHDFKDGAGEITGAYGPWFIRLRTGWKGIGIHGTHDPGSRGSMVSEGCIRMLNDDLNELKKVAFRNMKVVIEE